MKTLSKVLGASIMVLGMFALIGVACLPVGTASASPADTLQPASVITYNEEVIVNDTIRVDSAYIGKQDVGGVTFFNGTIVNSTTDSDTGAEIPVTFGDDVRIDGEIFRTEVGGDNPLKLADSIRPQTDDTYDLGTSTYNFKDGYFAGTVNVNALGGTGVVSSTNITDGTITGSDISSSADLNVDTITAAGDITTTGDINQSLADNGAMKAMIYVPADGDCTSADSRQWTHDGSTITCGNPPGPGTYSVDFDFDISSRYFHITPVAVGSCYFGTIDVHDSDTLLIYTNTGIPGDIDTDFVLTVY